MDLRNKAIVSLGLLIFLVVAFFLTTNSISKHTGYFVSEEILNDDAKIIKCLESREITVFINSETPFDTLDNLQVSEYIVNFDVFNCLRNQLFCTNNGIKAFPSFIIGDEFVEEDVSVEVLSSLTGCDLV